VGEGLDWLEKVKLPPVRADGRTPPTFIEIGTDRPIDVHRRGSNIVNGAYYVDYSPEKTLAHYSAFRRIDVAGMRARLARLIAPVEFGQVGLATAYIGFWALFAAFGVGSAVVQRPELTERMLRAGFTLSLVLGLLASVLVFLTAPLAARMLGSASLTEFIRALSATFLLASPGIVAEALLQRDFEWQRLTRLNVISSMAQSLASVALALPCSSAASCS
jgi:hypothetical protein